MRPYPGSLILTMTVLRELYQLKGILLSNLVLHNKINVADPFSLSRERVGSGVGEGWCKVASPLKF